MSFRPVGPAARGCAAALALGIALGGCITTERADTQSSADGRLCGTGEADAVHLEVRYGADGMPSVEPEVCEVDRGTRVTWRGPVDTPVEFAIRFKGDSPVTGEQRGTFVAERGEDRYRVARTLDGAPGRYNYAVTANGRELDPAIIIR